VNYTTAEKAADLSRLAQLVLAGKMMGIQEGGIVGGASSSVVQVEAQAWVKGSSAPRVYVELLHSPAVKTMDLEEVLPSGRGLWFLQAATDAQGPSPLDEGRGQKGLPPSESLLGPASPQGLVMACEGMLLQPLEPDHESWFTDLNSYASLEDLESTLTEAP
jgi:hypothetical protein